MAIHLTEQEQGAIKARFDALPSTIPFAERFAQAALVLPEDRRLAPKYPSGVPWLGVARKNGPSAVASAAPKAARKTRTKAPVATPPPLDATGGRRARHHRAIAK